jgi:hypothetical protein
VDGFTDTNHPGEVFAYRSTPNAPSSALMAQIFSGMRWIVIPRSGKGPKIEPGQSITR